MQSREDLYTLLKDEGLDPVKIKETFLAIHPTDLVTFLDDLGLDDKVHFLESIDTKQAACVLEMLPFETKIVICKNLSTNALAKIISFIPPDHATDIITPLDAHLQQQVLSKITDQARKVIQKLMVYPKHTAGGIMTPHFVKVQENSTVSEAIETIKTSQAEIIADIYVVDNDNKLKGYCHLKTLLGAMPDTQIASLMQQNAYFVKPYTDQEEIAKTIEKFNLKSLPVVDDNNRLIGVITVHDILPVLHQEASEDMFKLAGSGNINIVYDPVLKRFGLRIKWLLITLVIQIILSFIIFFYFKHTLEKAVILAAFIPVIIATAGNVGLQSSTLVVRALALGQASFGKCLRIVIRELKTGVLLGIACGVITAFIGYLMYYDKPAAFNLALSILTGMLTAIAVSATAATFLPFLLHKLGQDPAISSGPFITSCNDLIGTTIYLLTATLLQI